MVFKCVLENCNYCLALNLTAEKKNTKLVVNNHYGSEKKNYKRHS